MTIWDPQAGKLQRPVRIGTGGAPPTQCAGSLDRHCETSQGLSLPWSTYSTLAPRSTTDTSISSLKRRLASSSSDSCLSRRIAAAELDRPLEREPRGAYTGSMGWIEPSGSSGCGDAAFNVLIRTLEIEENSGVALLGLGSGLVVDSVVEDEWAECLLKGKFVASDGNAFDLIETMRFEPDAGISDLDRHLDRLSQSAARFDFPFNRHSARNELQAATFRREAPAMLRLLLSPKGTMAIELKGIPECPPQPVQVAVRPLPVAPDDFRLGYKTTARAFMETARRDGGLFETIFVDPDGRVTEGSFTTIFVERDGKYLTPPLKRGLLPGLLRARLIEEGKAQEADLRVDDLADGFMIGNAVRGLIRARLA